MRLALGVPVVEAVSDCVADEVPLRVLERDWLAVRVVVLVTVAAADTLAEAVVLLLGESDTDADSEADGVEESVLLSVMLPVADEDPVLDRLRDTVEDAVIVFDPDTVGDAVRELDWDGEDVMELVSDGVEVHELVRVAVAEDENDVETESEGVDVKLAVCVEVSELVMLAVRDVEDVPLLLDVSDADGV